jgi:hypothetical protein
MTMRIIRRLITFLTILSFFVFQPTPLPVVNAGSAQDVSLRLDGSVNAVPSQDVSLALDGFGAVRVPNHPTLSPAENMTITAWIRHDDAANCGTILGKNWQTGIWLGMCPDKLRLWVDGTMYESKNVIPTGEWTHVAVALAPGSLELYLNGMLDTGMEAEINLPINQEDWVIGSDFDSNYGFVGVIASVHLWTVSLAQDQIQALMMNQVDTLQQGLLAAWQLQGSAGDVFNRNNGTVEGTALFNGTMPPAFLTGPIDIPLMGSSISVDGICSPDEYVDALRLPIWVQNVYGADNLVWAKVIADNYYLYVCMEEFPLDITWAEVYVDTFGNGGSAPANDDFRVRAVKGGTQASHVGNGSSWVTPGMGDYQAVYNYDEFKSYAEFSIDRSIFSAPDTVFRMQMMQSYRGAGDPYDYGWPVTFNAMQPTNWLQMRISQGVIRPDNAVPSIDYYLISPATIQRGDYVGVYVQAFDDTDLAQVDIYIDTSVPRHTCTYPGTTDTWEECQYSLGTWLSAGQHTFYARATDHRGRVGWSERFTFRVHASGTAPQVSPKHAPVTTAPGGAVTITAKAVDIDGIRSISIQTDLPPSAAARYCEFPSGVVNATCGLTFTAPTSRRIVNYWITARDYEGLETTTQNFKIIYGNTGVDSDNDGLVDSIEMLLCTDPYFPDTDQDTLMDGYEVLGMYFPGDAEHFSDYINLPAMGANPCFKDVFVQYDYERGARFRQSAFDYGISLYREHGINLHVTENERTRSGNATQSALTAVEASATVGPDGFYFKPIYNWTHQYMYTRYALPTAGSYWTPYYYVTLQVKAGNCSLTTSDPQRMCPRNQNDNEYAFIHELGHHIGLGHGGRTVGGFVREEGGLIHYGTFEANYDPVNFKPNYVSNMNYFGETSGHASDLCYNPTTQTWLGNMDFASAPGMPTLNEGALDERPTSAFATALRARSCSGAAGYVPVTEYWCHLSPTNHILQFSDGARRLMYVFLGSSYYNPEVLTGQPEGLDWNCDHTISDTPVSSDINYSGSAVDTASPGQILAGNSDWSLMPAGRDCTIGYNGGYKQPELYRNQVRGKDCNTGTIYGPLPQVPGAGYSPPLSDAYPSGTEYLGMCKAESSPAQPQFSSFTLNDLGMAVGALDIQRPAMPSLGEFPEDEPLVGAIPNLEICDGYDNDGDGQVDEDCPDDDSDGIINTLDNCPSTPNPDQADRDFNLLGDACQFPQVTSATAVINLDGSVTITWQASTTDSLGFNLYRLESDGTPIYLGNTYPTTTALTFTDLPDPAERYTYLVRPVNLMGVEGEGLRAATSLLPIFVPLIIKD